MYQGKTKKVLAVFGFLIKEYNLQFKFQSFDMWHNFYGPMDTYSFYNDFGCLTLHNAVQRGEWSVYVSHRFSQNQYSLMEREVCLSDYTDKRCWTVTGWLKSLAQIIKTRALECHNIFGIPLENKKD